MKLNIVTHKSLLFYRQTSGSLTNAITTPILEQPNKTQINDLNMHSEVLVCWVSSSFKQHTKTIQHNAHSYKLLCQDGRSQNPYIFHHPLFYFG